VSGPSLVSAEDLGRVFGTGDAAVRALDDARLTELRRDKVGFVFQFFNLRPVLSAEENILLPLSLAGRDADRALRAVGMSRRQVRRTVRYEAVITARRPTRVSS